MTTTIWITALSIVGLIVVNAFLLIVWVSTGFFGKAAYKRLRRVYSLQVVWYWLDRLEKEGTHCFEKAEEKA